ncbi:MAG: sulfite exporter TauE/SafE family protein [Sulfitobacter sp.]
MDLLFPDFTTTELLLALLIAVLSGFVKGVVGFAMPLILISGLTLFIAPELALAGLILPTLITNAMQALRQGRRAAWDSIRRFRVFLISGGITLFITAQFVRAVPDDLFNLILGIPVIFFSLLQLFGITFNLAGQSARVEAFVGGFAGAMGGIAGFWGPPTVAYLSAIHTSKNDQMRIQGVIYGLGAVALLGAHVGSGVLRAETWPFSAALILPAVLGMWLGGRVIDRIDQHTFRHATLLVLLVAGLNLIRRGLF